MSRHDYYAILGLAPEASDEEIRAAYRELAKRTHPDHAGGQDADGFRDVREAYEVLSDADRRRAYDLSHRPRRPVGRPPAQARTRRPADPLVPPRRPEDLRGPGEVEEIARRASRRYGAVAMRSASGQRVVHAQIGLSPAQARLGTLLALAVPADVPCSACGGSGRVLGRACPACGGRGRQVVPSEVRVAVPPGTASGSRLAVQLGAEAILVLHVEVVAPPG